MTELEPPSQTIENASSQMPAERRRIVIAAGAAAIVLLTFLAYVLAFRAEYIWDDDYHVLDNRLLHSLGGLQQIWFDIFKGVRLYPLPQYYPMTHTTFWIEQHLWGLNPTGYHTTNIILHALNALLIWLVLSKLDVPGGWLASAAWAVHPINVESVAWISERKNVLSLFFFLSSLYIYLRYSGIIAPPRKPSEYVSLPIQPERIWALSAALFFFALMSKTVTSSLPAVILLIMWWKRGRLSWKDVYPLLPFFVAGIGAGFLTSYMEVHRVGAQGPDWDFAPTFLGEAAARTIIAGQALWFYAYKLLIPYPLSFNYPRWDVHTTSPVQWLYPLSALAVIALAAMNVKRIGRGPLTAVLFYVGTLFPALGFINVLPMRYAFVADHFVYLPSIGLIALAAATGVWTVRRFAPRDIVASGAPAAGAAAILVVYLLLSVLHTRAFQNRDTLWSTTLTTTNQRSWFAANNYGVLLLAANRLDRAEAWFNKVLRLKPDHAEAHYNLGLVAERRRETNKAIELYQKSLELRGNYELPKFRLAMIARSRGDLKVAEELLREIVAQNPFDENSRLILGTMLARQGKDEEALNLFQEAADINPFSATPYIESANVHIKLENGEQALRLLAQAGTIQPNNPAIPNNAGLLWANSGHWDQARMLFERALRIDPNMVDALTNLGVVAARQGQRQEARQLFERALEINPDFARARDNLNALLEGRLNPATTRSATAPAGDPARP